MESSELEIWSRRTSAVEPSIACTVPAAADPVERTSPAVVTRRMEALER
jgi:hypothetical protein